MRTLYEAANAIEAHMLQGVLHQEGIATTVQGAWLQGAVGELPAMSTVRLLVDDDRYDDARAAVARWQAGDVALGEEDDPVG